MTSPYRDLDRPPLSARALAGALDRNTGAARMWREIRVLTETGSTNADVAAAARAGEPEGLVVVAERQLAGRGRLDRTWTSPPRAGLTFSMLLRPPVPAAARPLLPLLTATALAAAAAERAELDVRLKWPNDLVVADRKVAGLLAEAVPADAGRPGERDAVVVGVGLNVSTTAAELPDAATSLAGVLGRTVDRGPVLLGFLRAVERRYRRWTDALGDPVASGLARDYLAWSSTVGTTVAVSLPDGSTLEGVAQAVDWDGRLVVATAEGTVELASGDVRHLRRA